MNLRPGLMKMAAQTHNRTCCACRSVSDKKELVRIVRSKDGNVTLDLTGRANGRGAYICRDIKCLQKARKSHALEKALGVAIPEEIFERFEKELITVE